MNNIVESINKIKNDEENLFITKEEIEIEIDSNIFSEEVIVYLAFRPKPKLFFKVFLNKADLKIGWFISEPENIIFTFPLRNISIDVYLVDVNNKADDKAEIIAVPRKKPVTTKINGRIKKINFHLLNFSNFHGENRAIFSAGDWQVTINSIDEIKDKVNYLKAMGGYRTTHVGKIEATGGISFSQEDIKDMMDMLYYYFSFCRGFWTGPLLPVGYDKEGEKVWEEWGARSLDPWQGGTFTWFDKHHGEILTRVFSGFLEAWNRESLKETVKHAIYWYIRSNTLSAGTDGSIVLTQAALERLAWTYIVEEQELLSKDGFNKITAADQIRLLISLLNIPIEIPSNLDDLKQAAKAFNWKNGPQAFTETRNNIVHPQKSNERKKGKSYFEAWNLGQWYIELILLNIFNYNGEYANRLRRNRYVGQVEVVPGSKSN